MASFVPSAWALGLPPKIEIRSYQWSKNLKDLPVLKASSLSVSLGEGSFARKPPVSLMAFQFHNQSAHFLLEDSKILALESVKSKRAIFSVELGFRPVMAHQQWGIFSAWKSTGKNQFFVLNRFGQRAYRVEWSDDSQIVDVLPCSASERRYLVVENVNNGFVRFVFFDSDMKASGYTIFDLSQAKGVGDVAQAFVSSRFGCEEITLKGAFGEARVAYPQGSLR